MYKSDIKNMSDSADILNLREKIFPAAWTFKFTWLLGLKQFYKQQPF